MTTEKILVVLMLVFISGFISSQVMDTSLPKLAIPFMVMIGGFFAIAFSAFKHQDDLNLARKKDAALEYIKYVSEYRSALLNIINSSVKNEDFQSAIIEATKNMIAALDKLHVVSNDVVSNKIELKNTEIVSLMMEMSQKSQKYSDDKRSLIKCFIKEGIFSKLNLIRYEIIDLVNSEVGGSSDTKLLKQAIESNNKHFEKLFLNILK